MKRLLLFTIFVLLLFSPCALALTQPVISIPYCFHQDMFLWNSTGTDGNRLLVNYPELDSQRTITSPAFASTSGEITVGTWTTAPFTQDAIIDPGLWVYSIYAKASSDAGTTTLKYRMFNKTSGGTITWLFFGNAFSEDINSGVLPKQYITSYARRNITWLQTGDRLGIQINASTDNSAARTVSIDLAGNTNASVVSIGYWVCSVSSLSTASNVTYTYSKDNATPLNVALFVAAIGITALLGSLLLSREVSGVIMAIIAPFPLIVAAWQFMSIDIVTSYGSSAISTTYALMENHTIYTIYPVSIIMLVLFGISVLNIYRIIMAARPDREDED